MKTPIARLADAREESLYGAKAARLSRALRAGFQVPDGFAIPVATLDSLAGGSGHTVAALQDIYREVRDAVAVRSSAVGEDSPEASYAGQYVTRLNVKTFPRLLQSLIEVRKSAFSEAVLTYRQELGIVGPPRMAAIIQEQIDANCAGVLYSSDPTSGQSGRVAEASWGLGQGVVSALVRPDRYFIRADGGLSDAEIGVKTKAVKLAADGGTVEIPIDDERAKAACLRTGQLASLAELAARAEEVFGPALDIEWAFAGDVLWLLQVRPLSTRADKPSLAKNTLREPQEVSAQRIKLKLAGTGASLGNVEGVARFHSRKGEALDDVVLILGPVTPQLALELRNVAGVVASVGGITSHGANILREFGVPCLVGVKDLDRVEDGSLVRLDCFEGTLEVLDEV